MIAGPVKLFICAVTLLVVATGCASNGDSSLAVSAPTSTGAPSDVESRARLAAQTEMMAFVRAVRSKLGDSFVATSGVTDDADELIGIDVILVDNDTSRRRVDEVRALFASTVPSIPLDTVHFVFSPVSERALLAAYEEFNATLSTGGFDLASFRSLGLDRASGSLEVVLDGSQAEAAQRDSDEINAWAEQVAPISVRVTIS